MVCIYITSHNFDIQLSNQLQNNINLFFVFFEAESCVCYNQMVFISINIKYTNWYQIYFQLCIILFDYLYHGQYINIQIWK